MTDPTNAPEAGKTSTSRRPTLSALPRRLLLGAAFVATFAAGGLVMSGTPASAVAMAMEAGGMGGHAGMHMMMQAHLEKMLTAVGATPDQRSRIETIMKSSMGSLAPMHARMEATHAQLHALLTAPVIDRAALEQLRAARMADFDTASKTLVAALADSAAVLTPEQRAKLGTLMAQHQHPGM